MINLLVTGYTGFVGVNFLKLIGANYSVRLLGRTDSTSGKFYRGNIDSTSNYCKPLQGTDVIVHCAAKVHVMSGTCENSLTAYRAVNTEGTLNLARQAAEAGVKRFIYVSSIKVNGESTSGQAPFKAFDSPNPQDPYGHSKAEAEQQLLDLGNKTGMEIVIIRPPLVYGEGVKANFASLMRLVGKGVPLPFRMINSNKRSLVSVYNLVDLIKVCIEHPKAASQIFLVSDDDDLSTSEMITLMAKVQGKTNLALPIPELCFKVVGKLAGKQDVVDRLVGSLQVDISHTKKTLGWKPPYSVEYGFFCSIKK